MYVSLFNIYSVLAASLSLRPAIFLLRFMGLILYWFTKLFHHGDSRFSLAPRKHSDFLVTTTFVNQADNFVVACLDASIA